MCFDDVGFCCGEPEEEDEEPLIRDTIRVSAIRINEFNTITQNSGYKSIRLDDTESVVILYYILIFYAGRITWSDTQIPYATCMPLSDSFIGYIMEKSDAATDTLAASKSDISPWSPSSLINNM
jgi:hypothetical protein